MNHRLLSYPLSKDTPVYPGDHAFNIVPTKRIKRGDSCNTYLLKCSNHAGTHIDAPRHFFDSGRAICDYKIEELTFNKPLVLEVKKRQDELITAKDLGNLGACDILLIRTGFSRKRNQKEYIYHNPGFSAQAASLIRTKYPKIRAIGLDAISVSCYGSRIEGRDAHRILLGRKGSQEGILLIEDMHLNQDLKCLKSVLVIPLLVQGIDSAPCTVIGEFSA